MAKKRGSTLHKLLIGLKPGVSNSTHLLAAVILWTAVGCGLMGRGTLWLVAEGKGWYILPAVVAGSVKSFFFLDKSVRRSIDRVLLLADGSCLGAVYSLKTWGLVLMMMAFGYLLRHLPIPVTVVGFLYVAVGWALLFSSRNGWTVWRKNRE